jgi:hypothetical protein
MKELAADIVIVIGPAGVVYYLIGDPWVSAVWIIVGLTVRWYQRIGKSHHMATAMKGAAMRGINANGCRH